MTLISRKHHFAYVHIYKAGGTSVTNSLIPYARLRERVANQSGLGKKFFHAINEIQYLASGKSIPAGTSTWYAGGISKHASLEDVVRFLGPKHLYYKLFTTFRNPLEWVVSQYTYIRIRPLHAMHEKVVNQTLSEFVCEFIARKSSLQSDFIKPSANGRHIDCIVQLEKFDIAAPRLYEFLGIPRIPSVLPRLNPSSTSSSPGLSAGLRSQLENYLAADLDIYDLILKQKGILIYQQ